MKLLKLLLCVASVFCVATAADEAAATTQAPKSPKLVRGPGPQVPPELLKQFDKDGDGKLSPEEREALHAAMKARAAEKKGEAAGKMSIEERKAAMQKARAAMKEFDKDGDGKLSAEELAAAKAKYPELSAALERMANGRAAHKGDGERGKRGPKPPKEAVAE